MKRVRLLLLMLILSVSAINFAAAGDPVLPTMTMEQVAQLSGYKVIATGLDWMIIEVDGVEYLVKY